MYINIGFYEIIKEDRMKKIAIMIRKSPSAIVHPEIDFLVIPSYRPYKFLTIFPS